LASFRFVPKLSIAVPRATLTRAIELEADRCVVVLGCGGRPRWGFETDPAFSLI